MAMVFGEAAGAVGKFKTWKLIFTGFAAPSGAPTSVFGAATDINCEDVEYTAIGLPDTEENEEETIETNLRTLKDAVENKGWASLSKINIFNDKAGNNWKACIAAKQTGATGTVIYQDRETGENVGAWKMKVASVEGAEGGAAELATSFAPTFTVLEEVSAGA